MRLRVLVAALLATSGVARADSGSEEPPATFHKGQFGVSGRLALGMRAIGPRDDTVYCGQVDTNARNGNASVCTGRAPLSLDLELAYGIAQHIELLTELRIGLEKDFGSTPAEGNSTRPWHVAPGARFFFSEGEHTKFFVQPMFLIDPADYNTTKGPRGTEFGVRALQGYWIDVHRAYGFYVFIGESAEFSPWIIAEFEGGIGFQGRYP